MARPQPSPLLRKMVARAMASPTHDFAASMFVERRIVNGAVESREEFKTRMAMDKAVEPLRAAGICFVTPDGQALFLKRTGQDHAGEWCFPGGGLEPGETAEDAACRESREEIGALPYGERKALATDEAGPVRYTTFRQPILRSFTPRLNEEHTEHVWAPLDAPPKPLHPGVQRMLPGLAMDAWSESDHPRAENGQFGSGGGGGSSGGGKSDAESDDWANSLVDKLVKAAGKANPSGGKQDDAESEAWADGLVGKLLSAAHKANSPFASGPSGAPKEPGAHHHEEAHSVPSEKAIAHLFSDSLGMERKNMPQVPSAHKEQFLSELRRDTTVKKEQVDASSLKPTQKDFKADQVQAFAKVGVDPNKGSIMVSSDGYVLDGHHRWAAAALTGGKITTIRVGMPIRELLAKAQEFNDRVGVERRTLDTPVSAKVVGDAWAESDHTRADNGQFGSGGGGAAAIAPPAAGKATAAAATPAPGAKAFLTPALYAEAQRTIALYGQKKEDDGGPRLTAEQKAKATAELAGHLAAAEAAKPGYDSKLKAIGKDLGAEIKLAGVKGGDRLLEKHVTDYNSDPSKMRDLVRGTIIVNDIKDIPKAMAAVQANFKVARVKDRFAEPMNTGYRDMLLNIELPGGIQGEIQIHIPEMIGTKDDIGHALYDIERKLDSGDLRDQLIDLQTRVYGGALRNHLTRTRSNLLEPVRTHSPNSAADSSSPSKPALRSLGNSYEDWSRVSKATQRPVGSMTTGTPSTSRKRDPAGISVSSISSPPFNPILPLAEDDEHWITVNGGGGKGTPLLISGGGVVIGGAGGNLNGKTLSPKSKSAARPDKPEAAAKFADIAKSLQNRNRSSAASVAQMNRIASNPNPRLLMAAPTMNDGAPVVTDLAGSGIAKLTGKRDWVVTGKREIPVRYAVVEADQLSASNRADGTKNADYAKDPGKLTAINNGRTAAVVEAYARGTADAYKAAIAKGGKMLGIPGSAIKAMKAPVLVRIMDAADVTDSIGDESNAGQTLTLSAVEQAQNDATRFDPSAIDYNDDGSPTDAAIKGFINAMPAAERQSLSPNGKPTKQAIDRMMAATFHAAYGDTELVGLMAQATDPESRNLINGMSKAAGSMAKLKDAGELDIRELVTGAAKQIINAVRSGVSIKKFLKQGDLLTHSGEDQIAALFAENARSAKTIGEKLSAAADMAYEESQRAGTDMFGEAIPTASREDILEHLHA